jgi:hypothetical protein
MQAVMNKNIEKRRSVRSSAEFGALVRLDFGENEIHYRPARVMDISTTGMCVTLSDEVELGKDTSVIGVIVEMPDGPGYFECRVRRAEKIEDRIELGAVMADSDPFSRQALYEFLLGRKIAKAA